MCPFVKTLTDSEQIKGGVDDAIFTKSPIGPISFNNDLDIYMGLPDQPVTDFRIFTSSWLCK